MDNAALLEAFNRLGPSLGPVYVRVKLLLKQAIAEGFWREGDRLPSENELIRALGISRMTVGRAVRELADDGIVERIIGLGTFVAAPQGTPPAHELRSRAEELAFGAPGNRLEVLSLEEVTRESLGVDVSAMLGSRVFRSVVIHYENDLPVQLESRFVSATAAPEYLSQDFSTVTPSAYLNSVSRFTHGTYTVQAILASEAEARQLRIDGSEPCLLIARTTWSDDGAVSLTRLLQPGSRSSLEGRYHS